MQRFSDHFEENIRLMQTIFEREDTFHIRFVKNRHHPQVPIAICFFDSMVDGTMLARDVAGPLTERPFNCKAKDLSKEIAQAVLSASSQDFSDQTDKVCIQIASGDCAVFTGDCPSAIILDIKGMQQRGIEQPDGEVSVAGPHEGFNENIMHNLSLIKKRLCSPNFKAEFVKLGQQSHTNVAVCYLEGVAKKEVVAAVRRRVRKISIDGLWDGNYIEEMLSAGETQLFAKIGRTQRPDVACAKLCEGRVVLIVNGAPAALTLPFLFAENFQAADDYYLPHPYANVGRMLRLIGFVLAFWVPGIYIALILHHPQMLPGKMLLSITAARENVPLSSLFEMLILFAVFEMLRETGSRMPEAVGLALNIVGAIVLGQSAVDAGFFSAPMVIVVAFSGTMGLMVRQLRGTVFFLRAGFILAGAWLGLFGVAALSGALWCYLHSLSTQNIPYLYTFSPLYVHAAQDAFWRGKIPFMNFRQRCMSDNGTRQGVTPEREDDR